jgi:hypothetical protein
MRKQNQNINSSENPLINILWTGGYDSSFRMIELSRNTLTIQPFYLCDHTRHSEPYELAAIAAITADIEMHPETKCTILPLLKIEVSDIEPDKEISVAYRRLHELTLIGPQYEWLARFAKINHGLELCLEKGESTKARNCILQNGYLKNFTDKNFSYCIIDEEKSSADLIKVFGSFHFPLPLFEITKSEMHVDYKNMGFEETMFKTWFCHRPVNNEPCGICNPCKSVIEEGLSFRLSEAGLKRYSDNIKYEDLFWYKYFRKIRRRIVGY